MNKKEKGKKNEYPIFKLSRKEGLGRLRWYLYWFFEDLKLVYVAAITYYILTLMELKLVYVAAITHYIITLMELKLVYVAAITHYILTLKITAIFWK